MALGGALWTAGPYSVTFSSASLGVMMGDEQAPTIDRQNVARMIDNTDRYGVGVAVDAIHQGWNYFAQMTATEALASVLGAMQPFTGGQGGQGAPGSLYSMFVAAMVLTAITGTSAAINGPLTITAPAAILAPNFQIKTTYAPILRMFPLRFQLFPVMSGGIPVNYTAI